MKIGILGGSFNPPHIGHLILAEYVRDALGLDKVIFIPCNIPPHKSKDKLLNAGLRLKMLKLILKGCKFFEASNSEIKRGGISFTIDTLEELRKIYPKDKLFLIIGSDLFKHFKFWKNPQKIKKIAKIVVVLREKIRRKEKSFIFIEMPRIEISSSLIRQRIKRNKSIKYLVPFEIEKYIKRYKLYNSGVSPKFLDKET